MKKVLFILFIFVLSLNAKVNISENYNWYIINVENSNNLAKELNRVSPIGNKNNNFHGYTEYNINFDINFTPINLFQCKVDKLDINLEFIYTMPKLKSNNKQTINKFNKYYKNLYIHENGHKLLTEKNVKNVEYKILNLLKPMDCNILSNLINKELKNLYSNIKSDNKNYDLKTDHGKTQGAYIN